MVHDQASPAQRKFRAFLPLVEFGTNEGYWPPLF
jgi:hypothetical protein